MKRELSGQLTSSRLDNPFFKISNSSQLLVVGFRVYTCKFSEHTPLVGGNVHYGIFIFPPPLKGSHYVALADILTLDFK
jgi:hypothetical protein